MAQDLNAENFNEKIKQGNVVVDFWAPWCGPCKQMKPEYEAAAEETTDATLYELDVDENQEVAGNMRIRGVPTVIFFKDGEEVSRFSGARDKAGILEEIKKVYN